MGFGEAIRVVLFEKYATFSGRAARSEYWWFFLFNIIVTFVFTMIVTTLNVALPFSPHGALVFENLAIACLECIFFIPVVAVTVRRLHDRAVSGVWAIIPAILSFISILSNFAVFFSMDYLSSLVENPVIIWVFICLFWVLALFALGIFVLTILKGTQGSNKFGPDPLGPKIDANVFE